MRLYWGRTEPRITNLTLKIMGMNVIALIMLLLGVIYLGQYQNELIEAKLQTFNDKVNLISTAIAETTTTSTQLSNTKTIQMAKRFGTLLNQRIYIFDKNGNLIVDSARMGNHNEIIHSNPPTQKTNKIPSPLKKMAKWIISIIPQKASLPQYYYASSPHAADYIDAKQALKGTNSISAWHDHTKKIILSAATPIIQNKNIIGAVLVTRKADDIEEDIGAVWRNIIFIFIGTLILTIFLSIYLSGLIARPLMRLAKAAEHVRTDRGRKTEIPDLSNRHDEIGELSVALRGMTEALNDRMDTIESFAADVSHELKNPLTSIRSAIETLSLIKDEKDKNQLMNIIQHDLQRIDRLISDISNASRLDSELTRETLERVDLHQLLHELISIYKDPLKRTDQNQDTNNNQITINNIRITLNLMKGQNIIIPGIKSRLMQVFENVITNAVSFSPPNTEITIQTHLHINKAHITISDQGPGIPETKLETIFKRFYSERPNHEDYGNNSGLGLSICRQIITALNGEIFAENIKDTAQDTTGSKFTVILPTL